MKDFVSRKTRNMDWNRSHPTRTETPPLSIGRWILLGIVLMIMGGYALWTHPKLFHAWMQHPKSMSVTSTHTAAVVPPPPVQFDFYHVLSDGSQVPVSSVTVSESAPSPAAVSTPTSEEAPSAPIQSSIPSPVPPAAPSVASAPVAAPIVSINVSSSSPKERYILELGSFIKKSQAESLRAKLMLWGFSPRFAQEGSHYVVYFGPKDSEKSLEMLHHQLMKDGFFGAIRKESYGSN